jgi:tetratricopeptide (TPR) repeat protein
MPPVDQILNTALAEHRAGNLSRAESLYRQVLEQAPHAADAWHLLGALYVQAERPAEAVTAIERAIELNPHSPDYYSHLGAAYSALQQHDQAIENLQRAVRLAPQSASAHYNLGTAQRNAEQIEAAVVSFRHAVAADPKAAEAHYNLANALRDLRRYEESVASYQAALAARPNYVKALVNFGGVLNELRRREEAVDVLRQAIAIDPRHPRAHMNLGCVLRDGGRFDEAVAELEIAVSINPDSAEGQNNLGTAYQTRAQYDRAWQCYERALQLDPKLPDAHFSHATALLRRGDLQAGFDEYEWRWKCHTFTARGFQQPRWNGVPLDGKTILLYAEQGLGDALQFVRYAFDVQQRGGRVIVECHAPLQKLLAETPGIDQLIAFGDALPPFDVHYPLMSLPGVLRLSESQLWHGPYLSADPQRSQAWRARLAPIEGFRVGVCWQGNPQHLFDKQRSFPLAKLAPLAAVPGTQLISLQKGPGTEQIAGCGFPVHELDASLDADGAFLDTAAVIQQLDLVVVADTAVAHLAGALAAPVWIPLSAHGDWRWMHERSDSPWYPHTRLYRQRTLDVWDDVIAEMAAELATRSAARESSARG